MAKQLYRIPVHLDRSKLDHEIPLEAWQMRSRPIPVKVLVFWAAVFFGVMIMVMRFPLFNDAAWYWKALLIIWGLLAGLFFGRITPTGEFVFQRLPALMAYLPPAARKVMTRKGSTPHGMVSIVGIKEVSDEGIITFIDGNVGQLYAIVGSASRLLFDRDRDRIMFRVDHFWRKAGVEPTWTFITSKEPQRVFQQVAAVERQNRDLQHRDPDLKALMQETVDVLTKQVGGQFDSVHQYLLVRTSNLKHLKVAYGVLLSERQSSSLFLRRCELLNGHDTLEVLGPIYRAEEREVSAL